MPISLSLNHKQTTLGTILTEEIFLLFFSQIIKNLPKHLYGGVAGIVGFINCILVKEKNNNKEVCYNKANIF